MALEKFDEAIDAYKSTLKLNHIHNSYYNMAWIYAKKNEFNSCIENLKLAFKHNSEYKIYTKDDKEFDKYRETEEFKNLIS